MTLRVKVSARAASQIRKAGEWWGENRPAAPGASQTWLAVYAVLMSVIGAFYYLRVIKVMYFDAAPDAPAAPASGVTAVLFATNGAAILALGVLPGPLFELCRRVFAG